MRHSAERPATKSAKARAAAAAALLSITASLALVAAPAGSISQEGCAQPYEPMWSFPGSGSEVRPPFEIDEFDQPNGPRSVGGLPVHTYGDGVLRVGEGDAEATFKVHLTYGEGRANLVEFEGRRYLTYESYLSAGGSFRMMVYFWDYDDPCRRLGESAAEPVDPTAVPVEAPDGPALPLSGTPGYTG